MPIDPRYQEQARAFVAETIKQVIPSANTDAGSAINAVLARGAGSIGGVLHQEVDHLLSSRDISEPTAISDDDMDLLMSNLLVTRNSGSQSFGFVRLYYATRAPRTLPAGVTVTGEDEELLFTTQAESSFDFVDYFVDDETGEFFLNVPFASEEPGAEYNVDAGYVTKMSPNEPGVTRVVNVSAFAGGRQQQSNDELLLTAKNAISTRTPLTRDGIVYFIRESFGSKIRNLLVVGAGDPEMLRDEVYDMGPSATPRFQIGKDGIGGAAQNIHVGGRTDCYMLFDAVNYVQQHIDIFADMTTGPITVGSTTVTASIVTGTAGTVAASGKLIINVGQGDEETVIYSSVTELVAGVTFQFTLTAPCAAHVASENSVKAVNNGVITVGSGGEITKTPVFSIAEIRLLDPLTFQPVGDAIPETNPSSRDPGWYIVDSNPFDILSARETKKIILDEKRLVAGNAAVSGSGSALGVVSSGQPLTQIASAPVDFTGYQGRQISVTHSGTTTTRVILNAGPGSVIVSGTQISGPVTFSIAYGGGDYLQFPVRVSYYTNTEFTEAQTLFDQDGKRTVCSDTLARAYMPMFLDFVFRYRGDGETADVRAQLGEVMKTAAGTALGDSSSSSFDFSDLVSTVYTQNLASFVETPFEIRIRRLNVDGSTTISYMFPSPDTVNDLAVNAASSAGSTFIVARLPPTSPVFTPPASGRLYLGGFAAALQETVDYLAVIGTGPTYTFILSSPTTKSHAADEPMKVARSDYDPENVVVSGTISDERSYRPFFGRVIVEKIS